MAIFGRNLSGRVHDALHQAAKRILDDADFGLNQKCWAWNLIHEHRVNPDWADRWFVQYGQPAGPLAMETALGDYYKALTASHRWFECYLDLDLHARTSISGFKGPRRNDYLVHVLDLQSENARRVWKHGRTMQIGELHSRLARWNERFDALPFEEELDSGDPAKQNGLMAAFFESWGSYVRTASEPLRGEPQLAPIWASLCTPFLAGCAGKVPEDYCHAVGLSKKKKTWIAVLRYSTGRVVDYAGPSFPGLLLPTQLEAGGFGRHFPSPPSCEPHEGGRAMDGRDSALGLPLPEYIHAPIEFTLDDWLMSGIPVHSVAPLGHEAALRKDRERHRKRLHDEFPSDEGWMKEATPA